MTDGSMSRFKASGAALAATLVLLLTVPGASPLAETAQIVKVYAAGSLREPVSAAARAFEAAHPQTKLQLTFGASGLLRERISGGEPADVFASANMAHPTSLSDAGTFGATRRFARDALCALARPGLDVSPDTLVSVMPDPAAKLGTSTPKADPSGDYAFELFERVEKSGAGPAGSARRLADKALQLTGGPNSPPPGRSVYGQLVASGKADLFLTYCTNALVAQKQEPTLQMVDIPVGINVGAD